ncbi:MAG: PAS domain S-box protein [Erythrobacter sp.]|nr:PAS domain S-box protein [Erythrobacter sp.]
MMDKNISFATHGPAAIKVCESFAGAAAIGVLYGLLAYLSMQLMADSSPVSAFWIGNAMAVGLLLGRGTRCRVAAISLCLFSNFAVNLLGGFEPVFSALLSASNMMEIVLALYALDRFITRSKTFDNLGLFLKLAAIGTTVPLVSGLFAATSVATLSEATWFSIYAQWFAAHSLQIPIFTSLILIVRNSVGSRASREEYPVRNWIVLLAATIVCATIIFAQDTYPFLFLAMPLVVLAAFLTGRLGTAVVVAILSLVAVIATLNGHGPISLVRGGAREQMIALQTFLASSLAIGLPVAVKLAAKMTIRNELQDSRDFVESILAGVGDLVFRVDENWRFTYANPRWKNLTGFTPEELVGANPFQNVIDRHAVDLRSQKEAIETGRDFGERIVVQISTADERTLQFAVSINPQFDNEGNFAGGIGVATDVTEKLAREHALSESEKRFRRLAETAPVGIFQANAAGEMTYVASQWVERFGLNAEDFIGQGWKDLLATGEELKDDPAFTGFDSPGDVRHRVLNFRNKQGEEFWWETINTAEFDEFGNICGFVGVAHDITEQRLAVERLLESERRFQTLANMAPAGIFRTDANGGCTYVNEAWKRLTGLEGRQWEGNGWANAVHPEDLDRVKMVWGEAVSAQRNGEEEFRWLRPDGSVVWTHATFGPEFGEAGSVSGYIGVLSDTTREVEARLKLAEREHQLALLADNATDAVLRLDLQGYCIYASPSARHVFGIKPSSLVGRLVITGFHKDDDRTVNQVFRRLTAGDADSARVAFRSEILTQPGEYQWIEANCGLVRDEDTGEPVEVLASLRNIDEMKKLEAELIRARDASLKAVESKTAFLANMSHEIRTPMNGLLGFTERALERAPDGKFRRSLEKVAESGRIMLQLLNDLLDFAKIESGHMQIVSEPTNLREIIQSVSIMMEPARSKEGLAIRVDISEDVPEWLLTDPLRVRQILLNLLGNALKFTDEGEVSVRVDADSHNSILKIAVSDTGIGISEDQLQRIFEDFVQAEATIARRYGGTGLGLSISMQLARMLGGSLSAESTLGEGSTFHLKLPLVACEEPSAKPQSNTPASLPKGFEGWRVLVAEDNDINQELISDILEDAAISFELVENGRAAVERVMEARANADKFDLVLMDIRMPILDGLSAAREIRASGIDAPTLPIVALTAHAYRDDIAACREAGMQGHLAKPFRRDDLLAVISKHLAGDAAAATSPRIPKRRASAAQKYADRKKATHALLLAAQEEANNTQAHFVELASQLHQLAGVAGLFGEADLGLACMRLEKAIRDGSDPVQEEGFAALTAMLGKHEGTVDHDFAELH